MVDQLKPDHWHSLTPYLSINDLCSLMRVSRDWFFLWIADRAWMHQRKRVCARFPELNALFDAYCKENAGDHISKRAVKSNTNKKRKTAWIMPRCGIWWMFARKFTLGFDMISFKKLIKLGPEWDPLIKAICVLEAPNPYRVMEITLTRLEKSRYVCMFHIHIANGNEIEYRVRRNVDNFIVRCIYSDGKIFDWLSRGSIMNCYWFSSWIRFIIYGKERHLWVLYESKFVKFME